VELLPSLVVAVVPIEADLGSSVSVVVVVVGVGVGRGVSEVVLDILERREVGGVGSGLCLTLALSTLGGVAVLAVLLVVSLTFVVFGLASLTEGELFALPPPVVLAVVVLPGVSVLVGLSAGLTLAGSSFRKLLSKEKWEHLR
jgi:hypothetical protein